MPDRLHLRARQVAVHPSGRVRRLRRRDAVCPVDAIAYEDDVPERWEHFTADNARFFFDTLPGLTAPLGSQGGAAKLGALGADTALVRDYPRLDQRADLLDNRDGFGH